MFPVDRTAFGLVFRPAGNDGFPYGPASTDDSALKIQGIASFDPL
jgi:hypothetical protein